MQTFQAVQTSLVDSWFSRSSIESERDALLEKAQQAKENLQDAKAKFDELLKDVVNAIKEKYESGKATGKLVAEKLKESAIKLSEEFKNAVKVIAECAKNELTPFGEHVKEDFKDIMSILEGISKPVEVIERTSRFDVDVAKDALYEKLMQIKEQLQVTQVKLDQLLDYAIHNLRQKYHDFTNSSKFVAEKLKESSLRIISTIEKSFKSFVEVASAWEWTQKTKAGFFELFESVMAQKEE